MHKHAFQRRDDMTCAECYHYRVIDMHPHCVHILYNGESHTERIGWNPHEYGCGDWSCTCSGKQEEKDTLYTFGHGRSKKKPIDQGEEYYWPKSSD